MLILSFTIEEYNVGIPLTSSKLSRRCQLKMPSRTRYELVEQDVTSVQASAARCQTHEDMFDTAVKGLRRQWSSNINCVPLWRGW
jgi:hypothetical protein